jgi:hypothetical protein
MSLQEGISIFGRHQGARLYGHWLQARCNRYEYEWFNESPDPDEFPDDPSDLRLADLFTLRDEIARCKRLLRENNERMHTLEAEANRWSAENDPGREQIDGLMKDEPGVFEDICNEYFQKLAESE